MQQLETDLNFISSLPNQPAITTSELKQEFDKSGNIIKDFINNTLEAEITSNIAACLASAKSYADAKVAGISLTANNISYSNSTSGLNANNVQKAIDKLKENVDSVSSSASSKIKYSDFSVTRVSKQVTLSTGGSNTGTISASKSGFYPLGIVGVRDSANNHALQVTRYQLTTQSSGSAVVTYAIINDMGASLSTTMYFDILWVKIS